MVGAALTIALWCCPIDSPFTVLIREKYGPTLERSANCVIVKDNLIFVVDKGKLVGLYPTENYSVSRKD